MNIVAITVFVIALAGIKYNKSSFHDPVSIERTRFVRGICTIIVMLHHLYQSIQKNSILSFVFSRAMGHLSVSLFFFYSGFGLIHSYKTKERYADTFFCRRILNIAVPYLFFILLYWAASFLNQAPYSVTEVMLSLVNGKPIVGQSWYIIVTLSYYTLFYLMIRIWKMNEKKILAGSIIGCLLWTIMCICRGFDAYWYISCVSIPIGIWWGIYKDNVLLIVQKKYLWCLSFFAAGVLGCFAIVIAFENIEFTKRAFTTLSCIFFVVVVQIMMMKLDSHNIIWKICSDLSLEIYLIHGMIMNIFRGKFLYIKSDLFYGTAVILSSIAVAYLLHLFFMRIKKWINYKLLQHDAKNVLHDDGTGHSMNKQE